MKTIGIVPWKTGENSFGITAPYGEYFSKFGEIKIVSHYDESIDLLVLPGGADVAPRRYKRKPSYYTSNSNVWFEWFDETILPLYIENNIPIFGICRGLQTLNTIFEGTLDQHLFYHDVSTHRRELVHDIELINGTKFQVNSLHHQGIKRLGNELIALGTSVHINKKTNVHIHGMDEVVEIIKHVSKPIVAVQWHPEEIRDHFSTETILNLLKLK